MKMASSASVNPVEKSTKKWCTGQRAPVAHPTISISPNRNSELGTEKWSFMSQRPAVHRNLKLSRAIVDAHNTPTPFAEHG
jgi:hypothetical protein